MKGIVTFLVVAPAASVGMYLVAQSDRPIRPEEVLSYQVGSCIVGVIFGFLVALGVSMSAE